METSITSLDTSFATTELAKEYRLLFSKIVGVVREFESYKDYRTLVVYLHCPCCSQQRTEEYHTVRVSPFKGIDRCGINIHTMSKFPAFLGNQAEQYKDDEEFVEEFRRLIKNALA